MVKIVADTTACLPVEQAKQLGIYYLPQIIVIGEETYRDDSEMNVMEFLNRQRTSPILPKTAAPPPSLFSPIYQEIISNGNTAVVITPSAQLSGTYRGAVVAAQDFPETDVRVIDSNIVAGGLGAVVMEAQKWAESECSQDEIATRVIEMSRRHRIYFLVDTLEYLYKGGRIGRAAHLFGSLLQMKPILALVDGAVTSVESQRTHKRALVRLKEIITAECPVGPESHLSVMHGDAELLAQNLIEELSTELKIPSTDIPLYDLTPAILVHSGPGVIAVSFFVK
jgi:DegV family protein with EDD domain